MKTLIGVILVLAPAAMAHADLSCNAAYATDQNIVKNSPIETKLVGLRLNSANAIPGTDREVWVSQIGKGVSVSLSSKATELGQVNLSEYSAGTEIKLDVPNAKFDEYIKITCQ